MHPDLTPAPTISISLSASVPKTAAWRTEFVTKQTHAKSRSVIGPKVISRELFEKGALTKSNISRHY